MPTFLALVGMFISVMLIGIILLQRGRGGGLVGALSGLGGQSAFGTKAGDTFTRITIGIAAAWVLLAGIHGQVLRARTEKFKNETKEISTSKEKEPAVSSTKPEESKTDLELGLGESKDESGKEKPKSQEPTDESKPDESKSKEESSKAESSEKSSSESAPSNAPKSNGAKSTKDQPPENSDEKK